jgi:hypothetical protein
MFVVHEKLPNKRKLKKQCNAQLQNFFLFDMVLVFFLQKYIVMHLLFKMKKHTFFE